VSQRSRSFDAHESRHAKISCLNGFITRHQACAGTRLPDTHWQSSLSQLGARIQGSTCSFFTGCYCPPREIGDGNSQRPIRVRDPHTPGHCSDVPKRSSASTSPVVVVVVAPARAAQPRAGPPPPSASPGAHLPRSNRRPVQPEPPIHYSLLADPLGTTASPPYAARLSWSAAND